MVKKIRLGVNIDHVATLRQVRGATTAYPDILKMTKEAVKGGADQITIHLREDRRHIQDYDLSLLSKRCPVSLNLEMAGSSEMLRLALKTRPDWVCFVPEKRQELTTEGGLDVHRSRRKFKSYCEKLHAKKIKVSMFIEGSEKQVRASREVGADAVELHTGHYCLYSGEKRKREKKKLFQAARLAHSLGLNVHAGHGLDYKTAKSMKSLPFLEELNIGHFLICQALESGLQKSVREMVRVLR